MTVKTEGKILVSLTLSELKDSLKKLKKFCYKKQDHPYLKGVRIKSGDGEIFLATTDLESEARLYPDTGVVEYDMPVDVVLIQDTIKIIEKLKQKDKTDRVYICKEQDGTYYLQVNNRTIKFNDQSENFPKDHISKHFHPVEKVWVYSVEDELNFKDKLKITGPALEADEVKTAFQHVCFRDGYMYATDSYRLAWHKIKTTLPDDILISAETLKKIKELLDSKSDEAVTIYLDAEKRHAGIYFQNMQVYTALSEENFPNLDQVIPKSSDYELTVDKTELKEELELYKSLDKNQTVDLYISDREARLSAMDTDNKIDSNLTTAYVPTADEFHIAFNARYLLEAVDRINDTDFINLEFTGRYNPIKVNNQELILPVRN